MNFPLFYIKQQPFLCILLFILIFGCNYSNEEYIVNLESKNGYGVFNEGSVVIWPSSDSIYYKNVPSDIDEYVVRSMPLQKDQYFWEMYLNNKIDKESFGKVASYLKIDTLKLTKKEIDFELTILIGTRNNKRIIIVDSDNDEDLGDEKVFEYDFPLSDEKQKEIIPKLPSLIVKYEYFENDKIINKSINLKPNPYKGSVGLKYETNDEIEKKYFLTVSFPEYRKGNISIDNINLNVYVSNSFSQTVYDAIRSDIIISPNKELDFFSVNNALYKIGDPFSIGKNYYSIDSITRWGDKLYLKNLGKNTHPIGISEGFYMPEFDAKRLDNSFFYLSDYSNKYILLDFWGTWCKPCIKLIPELQIINSEFKGSNFNLVSVAFDNDLKEVKKFVKDRNMDWEHIFINKNELDNNSLVAKLRISVFPTTILIAPNGEIIARDLKIDELKKVLTNKLKHF